jgi:hypothetical protein
MTTPSQQKLGRSFVGGPIPPSSWKTRARADARTKEGHCRPLPKEFRRAGFNYRLIAYERNSAIYEHAWDGSPDPARCYEVIRVRRREGFEINGRFNPPAEVYPRSEQWGQLGWTFCDKDAAFAKLREITATTGGGT